MRIFILFLFFFTTTSLLASEVSTQIHDIDLPFRPGEETLIFLTSGMVVKLRAENKNLLTEIQEGLIKKTWFRIQYNKEREIEEIEKIQDPQIPMMTTFINKQEMLNSPYSPSILKNLDVARSFFYDVRTNPKESQCYNRAHSWTYDWRVKRNLYSSKVWLFFTKRYIRKYKFEWWFHVAPMVHVAVDGEVKERIMDIKYARGPIKLKTWTDIFIRDNADCPVVDKYSDQADFPESGSCFVMKSSMYYYQPVDLEQLELTGIERNSWSEPEVKSAFLEALEIQL